MLQKLFLTRKTDLEWRYHLSSLETHFKNEIMSTWSRRMQTDNC